MQAFKPRLQVQTSGHFNSSAQAFPKVEEGIKHALKFEYTAQTATRSAAEPSTDKLLLDLGAVDPSAFNPKRLIRDCELVRDIATRHPDKLRRLLELFQPGVNRDRAQIAEAFDELKAIGFTEEHALATEGGLVWLVVIVGAGLLLGGCGSINTVITGKPTPEVEHPLGQPQPGSGPSTGPSTGPSGPSSSPTR